MVKKFSTLVLVVFSFLGILSCRQNQPSHIDSPNESKTMNHISEVVELIQRENITKISQLLSRLPEVMLSQYIMMEKSQSLHEASRDFPRIISFNEKATLIIAFNGSPNQANYNSLELIEYKPETMEYEFRSIEFSEAEQTPVVSEVNPAICQSCHGKDLRPNWEPYPVWPGAIGESFRTFSGDATEKYMEDFIVHGESNERYRHLHRAKNLELIRTGLPTTMASRLNSQLDFQMSDRLAHLIMRTPDYNKYRYAIVGGISACENFSEFIPASKLPAPLSKLHELHSNTRTSLSRNIHPKHFELMQDLEFESFGNMRWLFNERNIDMANWSFSFQDQYFFSAVGQTYLQYIIKSLSEADPNLKSLEIPTNELGLRFIAPNVYNRLFREKNEPIVQDFCRRAAVLSQMQFE